MARQTVIRRAGSITWPGAGSVAQDLDLPRDFAVISHHVRVNGRYRVTGAATAIQAEALRNVLASIVVEGSGSRGNVIPKNYSGLMCWRSAHLLSGTTPEYDDEDTLATAIGEYDFGVTFPIMYAILGTQDPLGEMTLLDAYRYTQLRLRVTTAALADIISGGTTAFSARNLTTGNPTIDVASEVPVDIDPDASVFGLFRESEKQVDVGSVSTDITANGQLNINSLLMRLMFYARGATAAPVRTARDTIVNALRVESSGQDYFNNLWAVAQRRAKSELGLETMPVGWNIANFIPGGDPTVALDTREFGARQAALQLHVDSAGNQGADTGSLLFVGQQELIPV